MSHLVSASDAKDIAVGLARALTSEQFAEILSAYIEKQKLVVSLSHELATLHADYGKLTDSEDSEMNERDKDRLATQNVVKWLVDLGQYEAATAVFNNFIDRRPQFAREVAALIIKRFENRTNP